MMRDNGTSAREVPRVLAERLETAAGPDRELDLAVFATAGGEDGNWSSVAANLLAEGLAFTTLQDILGLEVPAYTAALDATLPGENIVAAVYIRDRRQWAAVHRDAALQEHVSFAATEPLARRAAALKSLAAAQPAPAEREPAAADTEAEPEEAGHWRVLF